MGNPWTPGYASSSTSPSSTRPSSPEISQNPSNEGTHLGTGSALSTRLDEDFPNGQILTTPNLTFASPELETATRNFRPDAVIGRGRFFEPRPERLCSTIFTFLLRRPRPQAIYLQKIVMKVQMNCQKCRTKAMRVAAYSHGVTYVAIEGNDEDRVVVIGYWRNRISLLKHMRKVGHTAVLTVEEVMPDA